MKMNLQNDELTKDEKLVYLLNKIEEDSNCNPHKEVINDLKMKLILKINTDIESLDDKN